MKLNLLEPNAHYDMANGKPSSFVNDNDGSFLYRYNIEPEMGIKDGETQIGWKCREIRIWEKPTKAVLKKAIIRSVIDESKEFALLNDYNKHILEIKIDSDAVDAYKEFLQFTEDVDTMVSNEF
ncbi:MAG: hypothetical protein BWY38_01629 [Ignavibacteria bacterium ADurb.Bin266]|nr:MAG: hypothetical protein BWY38_01629 [Ignavibacteria bacterium ADurb.Bin266]